MLEPDEVTAMLRLRKLGWGSKRIARELGCSRTTVKRYVGRWRLASLDPAPGLAGSWPDTKPGFASASSGTAAMRTWCARIWRASWA